MAIALMTAFLAVKMRDANASVALYSVSYDVDGASISRDTGARVNQAVTAMLKTTSDPLPVDPQILGAMLQSVMGGVSRRLLESSEPEKQVDTLREEMIFLAHAYLKACSTRDT